MNESGIPVLAFHYTTDMLIQIRHIKSTNLRTPDSGNHPEFPNEKASLTSAIPKNESDKLCRLRPLLLFCFFASQQTNWLCVCHNKSEGNKQNSLNTVISGTCFSKLLTPKT